MARRTFLSCAARSTWPNSSVSSHRQSMPSARMMRSNFPKRIRCGCPEAPATGFGMFRTWTIEGSVVFAHGCDRDVVVDVSVFQDAQAAGRYRADHRAESVGVGADAALPDEVGDRRGAHHARDEAADLLVVVRVVLARHGVHQSGIVVVDARIHARRHDQNLVGVARLHLWRHQPVLLADAGFRDELRGLEVDRHRPAGGLEDLEVEGVLFDVAVRIEVIDAGGLLDDAQRVGARSDDKRPRTFLAGLAFDADVVDHGGSAGVAFAGELEVTQALALLRRSPDFDRRAAFADGGVVLQIFLQRHRPGHRAASGVDAGTEYRGSTYFVRAASSARLRKALEPSTMTTSGAAGTSNGGRRGWGGLVIWVFLWSRLRRSPETIFPARSGEGWGSGKNLEEAPLPSATGADSVAVFCCGEGFFLFEISPFLQRRAAAARTAAAFFVQDRLVGRLGRDRSPGLDFLKAWASLLSGTRKPAGVNEPGFCRRRFDSGRFSTRWNRRRRPGSGRRRLSDRRRLRHPVAPGGTWFSTGESLEFD